MSETPQTGDRYENPEAKQRLDEARREMEAARKTEQTIDAASAHAARTDLAAEEQPGIDLPDLTNTFDVDFRGHTFEFKELGDSVITAAQEVSQVDDEDDAAAGARGADFVYSMLGEKATHPDADEAYWRQYDLQCEDDDSVFDLFDRLTEEALDDDALDDEQQERVEEFRGE